MKRLRPPPIEVDDDDEDEFKPLFDYSETVPAPTFFSDDSDDEDVVITSGPKLRTDTTPAKEPSTPTPPRDSAKKTILDDDDDSWLMDDMSSKTPKLPKLATPVFNTGSYAVQQLRLKRQELAMLQHATSPEAIRRVEEVARMEAQRRSEPETPSVVTSSKSLNFQEESQGSQAAASEEKEKILLKVQNKTGGFQSIRIYTTDKLEKLFSAYARIVAAPVASMSFRFDGEQLSPDSTSKDFDMEEGDIIEVYDRS